jgi:hypothetical protein
VGRRGRGGGHPVAHGPGDPAPYLDNAVRRWVRPPAPLPAWSHVLFVSWAGVRGGESLVIALSLPMPPRRARRCQRVTSSSSSLSW